MLPCRVAVSGLGNAMGVGRVMRAGSGHCLRNQAPGKVGRWPPRGHDGHRHVLMGAPVEETEPDRVLVPRGEGSCLFQLGGVTRRRFHCSPCTQPGLGTQQVSPETNGLLGGLCPPCVPRGADGRPSGNSGPMVCDLIFVPEPSLLRTSRAEPGLLRMWLRAWVVSAGRWRAVTAYLSPTTNGGTEAPCSVGTDAGTALPGPPEAAWPGR